VQLNCENNTVAAVAPRTEPVRHAWLDRLGIGVSITCAIHCAGAAILVAAPAFAASVAPSLGERFEWAEGALLWAATAIGAFALVPAYLRGHRHALPLAFFAAGVAVLALSRWIEAGGAEIAGTTVGVALVMAAHVVNLRRRQGCDCWR
jgi:hypothetical protein